MAVDREEQEEERVRIRGKLPPVYDDSGYKGPKPVLGSLLLPSETWPQMDVSKADCLSTATFLGAAHSWPGLFGIYGFTANNEETKIRALISHTSPPVVLLELNSLQTFNMLDPVLAIDFHIMLDSVLRLARRSPICNGYPLGFVLQGAGPHLCPGGNHHPVNPPGATHWSMIPYVSSLTWCRMRELAIPGTVAMTGSAIGGGVAISLQASCRVAAAGASMAFGNLSRGANPVMWLSKALPTIVGMTAAASIYLTDATVSSCGAQRVGLISYVVKSPPDTKARALAVTRGMASLPTARSVTMVGGFPLSIRHFADENKGFMKSMASGTMFANVKGESAHETVEVPVAGVRGGRGLRELKEEEEKQKERSPRPFPMVEEQEQGQARPFRIKGAERAVCAGCGYSWPEGTVLGDSFYCTWCWEWEEAS